MLYLISSPQKPGEVPVYGWQGHPARVTLVMDLYSGFLPDGGTLPDKMNFQFAGHTFEFATKHERQNFALGLKTAWEMEA
jgi:hypothetical protein